MRRKRIVRDNARDLASIGALSDQFRLRFHSFAGISSLAGKSHVLLCSKVREHDEFGERWKRIPPGEHRLNTSRSQRVKVHPEAQTAVNQIGSRSGDIA